MQNLQNLYDEVAPTFNYLTDKRNEAASRIRYLEEAMNEAEENYDVANMEKFTTSLSSAKQVYERIESDLRKLQDELNGTHGTSLSSRIRSAERKDFQTENDSNEVQEKLKEIDKLIHQAGVIQQELQQDSYNNYLERNEMTQNFRPFLTGLGRNATLSVSSEYHRTEGNRDVKQL